MPCDQSNQEKRWNVSLGVKDRHFWSLLSTFGSSEGRLWSRSILHVQNSYWAAFEQSREEYCLPFDQQSKQYWFTVDFRDLQQANVAQSWLFPLDFRQGYISCSKTRKLLSDRFKNFRALEDTPDPDHIKFWKPYCIYSNFGPRFTAKLTRNTYFLGHSSFVKHR